MDINYSVLMSVYFKEKPEFLKTAMKSMLNQTIPTNDFVLVCDGPLTPELDEVINQLRSEYRSTLNIVRLEQNVGLGEALNKGIKHCKNELIARMDSDDISYPNRCEKQLNIFQKFPDISIVSGTVEEFSSDHNIVDAKRTLPEYNNEIREFAKKRNPFNHPCVMYKKADVEKAGGYQNFYLLEDYYLWIRMLMNGFKGYNLQDSLLHMRAGSDMYLRRSGWKYARSQIKLFKFMKSSDFINYKQFIKSSIVRLCSSIAPNWLRKYIFEKKLRK